MNANFRRELVWTAAAAALVSAFCALLAWHQPGLFWTDDYQSQTLPGFFEVARAWRQGEFPLLTPLSWFGGALAGEFQYGVFSVFLTLVVVGLFALGLSLVASATALSVLHLAVLAAGAFRLARRYALTPPIALMVAAIAALNGWIVLWGARNWFPTLSGFAWLPWAWWALERSLDRDRGPSRFLLPGLFLYLLVAAGGPSAIVMIGAVTAWVGAREVTGGRWRDTWPLVAAWAIGLGLAAPAWLALQAMVAASFRSEIAAVWTSAWVVPAAALPGTVLPSFPAVWSSFGIDKVRPSLELAGAFVPVAILLARALGPRAGFFRAHAWLLGLAIAVLVVSMLPGLGSFRWSFKWLPLFHLALALLAGRAYSWAEPAWRVSPGQVALGLALLVWGFQELTGGHDAASRSLAALTALAAAGWAIAEYRWKVAGPRLDFVPLAIVLLTLWLPYTRLATWWHDTPAWPVSEQVRHPAPLDPSVRYFSLYTLDDLTHFQTSPDLFQVLRPGNAAMWAGIELINGYSALGLKGVTWNFQFDGHGPPKAEAAVFLLRKEAGRDGLLAQMGVDGLVVSTSLWKYVPPALQAEWTVAWSTPVGYVLHRKTRSPRVWTAPAAQIGATPVDVFTRLFQRPADQALPTVLLAAPGEAADTFKSYGPVRAQLTADRRLDATVAIEASPDAPGLVVLARPWYPGYQARLNGTPVPVRLAQNMLLAVEVPAGSRGELHLSYVPTAITVGLPVAATTGLIGLVAWLIGRRRHRERVTAHASEGI